MTATKNMNDTRLKSLAKKRLDKQQYIADSGGLSVRVTPRKGESGNNLNWVFRYRLGGRDTPRQTLYFGKYPDLKLAAAREKRDQCRAWIAEGKDPKVQLQIQLEKALKPLTVQEALTKWIDEYAAKERVNAAKHQQQFNVWINPHIGSLPLEELTKHHLVNAIKKRAGRYPVAAGYVLRNVQQALKWLGDEDYDFDQSLLMIKGKAVDAKQQAKRSQRLVEDDSNQRLVDLLNWLDAGRMPPYYRNLLSLLIVFGARTQELRLAKTSEFNFETGVWTVPPEHNKTRKKDQKKGKSGEIKRPIPNAIAPMLKALCEAHKGGYLLGELKKPEAVSMWGGLVWKKLGHEEKWRLHDLRRTTATALNDLGVAPHVVESLLGHSIQGVAGIYNRSHYLPEKREALDLWCAKLEGLRNGAQSNVVKLGA
ncbi:tyrosine-type recombinase/integrase [Aliagarivorans taiwanensis]|uniref:tyrosine-type recombinase/integrase n=1 Tax=Aliagarivorans taiwanensis TaxID=561966 RepID=UPI0004092BAC|nr:site-specific integrase [Aliagarivorans taiwanensis]